MSDIALLPGARPTSSPPSSRPWCCGNSGSLRWESNSSCGALQGSCSG